jgi:hypothetical protein
MEKKLQELRQVTGRTIYEIKIKGVLTQKSTDWFDSLLINIEYKSGDTPHTILTCQVRDQAELYGILNWIYSLNMQLLQVMITGE